MPPLDQLPIDIGKLEAQIGEALGIEAHWVSLHWDNLQSPVSSRPSFQIDDREIVLVSRDGKVLPFHQTSEIFRSEEFPSRPSVSLFARHPEIEFNEDDLKKLREAGYEALKVIGEASYAV